MKQASLSVLLSILAVPSSSVENERELWGGGSGTTASVKQFDKFWVDSFELLENLDDYAAFWVKPHGCVWSECAVDDTDDNYMGDNRDGDEQWYQYRTQEFCANAAFSLYGIKRGSIGVFGCTRGHFINSFFTYGGADNLLKAVGITPKVYYDVSSYNNYNNGDDAYQYVEPSNSQCVAVEHEDAYNAYYYEEEEEEGEDANRNLGSQDADGTGYSSSLGCDADGNYVVATFAADVCDGNYFLEVEDKFRQYNRQHRSIGCHKVYSRGNAYSRSKMQFLLNNSWTCDLDLYPNGCPDPYGEKARYDFALKTVAQGGNAQLAYTNLKIRHALHILSVMFGFAAFVLIAFTYFVKNRERIRSKGGSVGGYFKCLGEDFAIMMKGFAYSLRKTLKEAIARRKRSSRRRKSKKKKRSRSKKSSRSKREKTRDDAADDFQDEEANF